VDPGAEWTIDDRIIDSSTSGQQWHVLVQRPSSPTSHRLPWLWLLHGSTSSAEEMRPVLHAAAEAMVDGTVPPMIIGAPDAPDGYRSSWWVDSIYTPPGDKAHVVGAYTASPGRPLERALLGDVLHAVEGRYGPPTGPDARVIGGISMGGAAALRWVLVRPDLFGAAVLLSPAVYEPYPSQRSSARMTGAFGTGSALFDPPRFRELMSYPDLLAARPSGAVPTRVVVLAGDEEPPQWNETGRCDLDLEAVRLHATLKQRADFRSSLRIVGGGHDWPVWERGIVDVLRLLAA
jgi:S-formylglutathione hydrolase FrmB